MRAQSRPHFVYRCYDKRGLLLYIGCALDVEGRMSAHRALMCRNPNSWFIRAHVDTYTAQEFANLAAARAGEKAAIVAESPLLNVHHNQGRQIPAAIIEASRAEQDEWLDALAAASARRSA